MLANPIAKREELVAELASNPYFSESGTRNFLRAQGVSLDDVNNVVVEVEKLRS